MASVKKNFTWNIILTTAGRIFPLIIFPYITRVLGVTRLGSIQYADSVVTYFTVFAMLGINAVGVREIAKAKGDYNKLSRTFSSLLFLNLATTFMAIVVLLILIQYIPSFESHDKLLYIGISKILCGTLLIEWLYKGLEDFRYITVRTIAIRCFYIIAVFLLVKREDDYIVYFILTAIVYAVNALINLLYSRKFVKFSFDGLNIKPYIKSFVILGVYAILTNMYGSFNIVFLGSSCGDKEVGFYTTATKLYVVILSVYTSFTTVMMPRMSSLVSEGRKEEFLNMTSKSIEVLLLFSFPLIVISEIYAPEIIRIIAGAGYEGAILPMRILMPLMLIIGYEQIIVLQMLMPLGRDKAILINSSVGAGIALVLNLLIVRHLGAIGSSVVWLCCEFGVAVAAQYFVKKYTGYNFPLTKILQKLFVYIPALIVCFGFTVYLNNGILSMVLGVLFVSLYFVVVEGYVLKTKIFVDNYHAVKNKVFLKNS